MADIDTPAGMLSPLIQTLEETPQTGAVSDSAAVGAPRTRHRFTRDLTSFSFTWRVDKATRASFEDFFTTTLARGSLPFNWTNPLTDVVHEVSFLGRKPTSSHVAGEYVDLSVVLQEI